MKKMQKIDKFSANKNKLYDEYNKYITYNEYNM